MFFNPLFFATQNLIWNHVFAKWKVKKTDKIEQLEQVVNLIKPHMFDFLYQKSNEKIYDGNKTINWFFF